MVEEERGMTKREETVDTDVKRSLEYHHLPCADDCDLLRRRLLRWATNAEESVHSILLP